MIKIWTISPVLMSRGCTTFYKNEILTNGITRFFTWQLRFRIYIAAQRNCVAVRDINIDPMLQINLPAFHAETGCDTVSQYCLVFKETASWAWKVPKNTAPCRTDLVVVHSLVLPRKTSKTLLTVPFHREQHKISWCSLNKKSEKKPTTRLTHVLFCMLPRDMNY